MPRRFQPTKPRRRHFIAEWRVAKKMTQAELAKRLGLTGASVSRIEDGKQPYTQDTLEAIADILGEEPSCLISHGPQDIGVERLLRQLSPERQREAIEIIRVLVGRDPKE